MGILPVILRVCLLMVLFCWRSSAARFDCGKAVTPPEKAICTDPKLSKLDEDTAAAYGALGSELSAQQDAWNPAMPERVVKMSSDAPLEPEGEPVWNVADSEVAIFYTVKAANERKSLSIL